MTVVRNRVLVHDNIEVVNQTGMSEAEAPGALPILVQAHPSDAEGPVLFRNTWCAEPKAMPARPLR